MSDGREAFDRAAREAAPRLMAMAVRLTGDRSEAEDLVQETLLRALRRVDAFEGRAAWSTYLLRILGNLWKNRLRSKSRSRLVGWFRLAPPGEDDAGDDAVADVAPTAEDRLMDDDRARRIQKATRRLEPVRRWTLLLREVEGLNYEEIAEVTGVPVGTVRSRLARARRDLRAAMEGTA